MDNRCGAHPERLCAWQLIYRGPTNIGQADRLKKIAPLKNWSTSLAGGVEDSCVKITTSSGLGAGQTSPSRPSACQQNKPGSAVSRTDPGFCLL